MRSRGRMVKTRWVLLLVSLGACRGRQQASETNSQKLTSPEVTVGQRLGVLPSAATSFAALELIDDPGALPSTDGQCTTGGGINNKGIVVGWDCRVSETFAPTA